MDRIDILTEKINDMQVLQDERGLDVFEEQRLQELYDNRSAQYEANTRQLLATEARKVSTSQKASKVNILVHIRVSMVGKHDLVSFNKLLQKWGKAAWVRKPHQFVYVLEQSGEDAETRGHNPHAHIRTRSTLTVGRLLAKLKTSSGLPDTAFNICVHSNVNALRQYMLGNKGDPTKASSQEERMVMEAKKRKCAQDKCWRIEEGLKMEYTVNV